MLRGNGSLASIPEHVRVDPELLELRVERRAADVERRSRLANVTAALLKFGEDDFLLRLLDERRESLGGRLRARRGRDGGRRANANRKITRLDLCSLGKDHRLIDGVFEFAHVARPIVALE